MLSQGNEIKVKVIAPFLFFKQQNSKGRLQIQLLKKKENTGVFQGDIIFNFRFYFLLFFNYIIPFDGEGQEKDEEITSSKADTVFLI